MFLHIGLEFALGPAVHQRDHAHADMGGLVVDGRESRRHDRLELSGLAKPAVAETPVLAVQHELVAAVVEGADRLGRADLPGVVAGLEIAATLLGHLHAVYAAEMRPVDAILCHLLWVSLECPFPSQPFAQPSRLAPLRDLGNLEARCLVLCVIPDEDHAVAFEHGVRNGTRPGGAAVRVRDLRALALGAPAPAVKRALDGVAHDLSTDTEMGTEVGTVSVEDSDLTALTTKGHEIPIEVPEPPHLAARELVGKCDQVPAVANSEGVS